MPSSVAVSLDGAQSCQQFGGYHNYVTIGGVKTAYAIIDECTPEATTPPLTLLQSTTFSASHEIAEAATDPFAAPDGSTSGFYLNQQDLATTPWNLFLGGEVADMCVDELGLGQDTTTDGTFTVQRIWNNALAAAGHDPCAPDSSSEVYFNLAPEQWLVTLNVGQSATFTADAFSDAAMAAWTVAGIDAAATSQTNLNPYITVTVNGGKNATVNNGDKVTVSVTLNQDPGNTQNGVAVGALLSGVLDASGQTLTAGHFWPFIVATNADLADAGLGSIDAAADLPRRLGRNGAQASPNVKHVRRTSDLAAFAKLLAR
jgi:hypothetical protein